MPRTSSNTTDSNNSVGSKTNITKKDLEEKLVQSELEKTQMMDMIRSLQEQINNITNSQNIAQPSVTITQNQDLTRTVKVISMLGHDYILSTKPLGGGKLFVFKKFGEDKNIKFTDMQEIVELYRKDFEMGRAILTSQKDYEDLQIGYAYENVLNLEQMNELLLLTKDEHIDIILDMNDSMQENVCSIIAQNIANGVSYDYNRIKELEDEGLGITKLADSLREVTEE